MIALTDQPFDPGALLAAFAKDRRETGAIATFTGLARAEQGQTQVLELEAYPGFTEAAIGKIAETARSRFELDDLLITHRIGRIGPGEPIVFVATAASHFDPHWDLDKDGEGLNPALAEAAKIAGKPAIVVQPRRQMAEWWFSTYTDGSWSYSHYIAGFTALEAVEAVAKDLGVAPGSLEANKLAWFVLSRVSDYRIYEVYQQAGFKMDAAKDLVVSILKDSAPYEVPKR